MANQFDVEKYVEKWDRIILPVMLLFIVSALVAVFMMNKVSTPECKRHEYIFCGTSDQGSHH